MITEKTFYFITDNYFQDFPDKGLMQNHETIMGKNIIDLVSMLLKIEKFLIFIG